MVHRGYHNIRSNFVYKLFYFREKPEVCPNCGATVNNGWYIKCEQDEAYQRAFEFDLLKDHNYHTQKSSAEDDDQFKIEEQVVRSKRMKQFGEYLPKKAKLEKKTSSDVSDSKFLVSKGTYERQIFLSLWYETTVFPSVNAGGAYLKKIDLSTEFLM